MADGGERTVENLTTAYNGETIKVQVTGPAGEPVFAEFRDFSAECSKRSSDAAIELTNEIKSKIQTKDIDRMLIRYLTESSAEAGMPYDKNVIK